MAVLIAEFSRRYDNEKTRHQYVAELTDLFRATSRRHPLELTDADVLRWCAGMGRPVANNTVRNRLSRVTTFVRWCVRHGMTDPVLVEALCDRTNPLRRIPRLYGKLQGKHPARWLSYDEAFGQLLASCRRDGEVGLRDELVLRLGLAGMRAAEIIGLAGGPGPRPTPDRLDRERPGAPGALCAEPSSWSSCAATSSSTAPTVLTTATPKRTCVPAEAR